MRKLTAICDICGCEKTYDIDKYEPDVLKGWGYIHINGGYNSIEFCPKCGKNLLGDKLKLKEEKDNDKDCAG